MLVLHVAAVSVAGVALVAAVIVITAI